MKQNKIIIRNLVVLLVFSLILATGCNKTLIVEPDACFTTNLLDSMGEYIEQNEFSVGEEIHFVSCGTALFEVIYTGDKKIAKELQKQDGTDSIIWSYNAYFPDKTSPEKSNYFNKRGQPLSITGLPLAQAGEFREAIYEYSEEGEYEVYLEAINRNEDGLKTKVTTMKKISIISSK